MVEGHDAEPTERTPQGYEVRVPARQEFFGSLTQAARTMLARLAGGPGNGRSIEVDEPPRSSYIWNEVPDLETIPEGARYPEEEGERHRYVLGDYNPDPLAPEPRATYDYDGLET